MKLAMLFALVLTVSQSSFAAGAPKALDCRSQQMESGFVTANIQPDPSTGSLAVNIQQESLNGFFGPVRATVESVTTHNHVAVYTGQGFELVVNLATGTNSLPPQYESTLKSTRVLDGEPIAVTCVARTR